MNNLIPSDIESTIYQSIFDKRELETSLIRIADQFNCNHVHLLLFDNNIDCLDGIVASTLYNSDESLKAHLDYMDYVPLDTRHANLQHLEPGQIVNHETQFDGDFRKSEFYQDFLKKHYAQQQDVLRMNLSGRGFMTLHMIRNELIDPHERSESLPQIQAIGSIIQHAVITRQELEIANITKTSLTGLLSEQNIGVVFLDKNNIILEMNEFAKKIISRGDGFLDNHRILSVLSRKDRIQFNKLISCASSQAFDARFSAKQMLVNRADGQLPYKVTFCPLEFSNSSAQDISPAVMVLINSPECEKSFPEYLFKIYFGLTRTELALCKAIFFDQSLSDYAHSRSIKVSTARWTLDNIFAKTGTHSQAQLKSLALKYS